MSLAAISWIIGIVGALGVAGLVAIAILAPTIFLVVWTMIKDFVATRLGLAIVAGAAALYLGLVVGDINGRREARAICDAAQKRAEEQAQQRDNQQAVIADDDAKQREHQLDQENVSLKEKLDAYQKELAARAQAGCALGSDDLKRM